MINVLRSVEVFGVPGGSRSGEFSPRFALGGGAACVSSSGSSLISVWGAPLHVSACRVLSYSSRVRSVVFSVFVSSWWFGLAVPASRSNPTFNPDCAKARSRLTSR